MHNIVHGTDPLTDSATQPRDTNYAYNYYYNGAQPHAVTDTRDIATSAPVKNYTYDQNGNMTGWTSQTSGQNRTIVWNEENRVKSIADSGSTTVFLYDDAGERAVKRGQHGESVYINRFYAVKNGDLGSKHIFAGETRVVTKLEKDGGSITSGVPGSVALVRSQGIQNAILQGNGQKKGINRRITPSDGTGTVNPPIEKFQFFYHGDHLGSSSYITDDAGVVYQHLEYFPHGESWVEEGGSGQMPYYRFTGKELDPETGLYYYGARYYDPVLSRWISADPALEQYLPTGSGYEKEGQKLPGDGGVYRPTNNNLYHYAGNNPLKYIDPTGEKLKLSGTKTDVADFQKFVYTNTGYKIKASNDGTYKIEGARNKKVGNEAAAKELKEAITMKETIALEIVRNEAQTFVDAFVSDGQAKVDIGDLLSIQKNTDKKFTAARLTHILNEQNYAAKNKSGYGLAHDSALKTESPILGGSYRTNRTTKGVVPGGNIFYDYQDSKGNVIKSYELNFDSNLTPQ